MYGDLARERDDTVVDADLHALLVGALHVRQHLLFLEDLGGAIDPIVVQEHRQQVLLQMTPMTAAVSSHTGIQRR